MRPPCIAVRWWSQTGLLRNTSKDRVRLGKGYEPQAVSHSTAAVGTHGPHIVPFFSVRHGGFRIRSMQDVCGSAYQFWLKHVDLTLHVWIRLCKRFRGPAPLKKKQEFQLSLEYRPAVDLLRSHYAYLPYFSGKATATAVDLSLALCLFALLTGAKKHHIKQNKTIKQENGKPHKHHSSKKTSKRKQISSSKKLS